MTLGALVALAPWLWWNHVAYGALSGAKAVDAITGGQQATTGLTVDGLQAHLTGARLGLWQSQVVPDGGYRRFWEWFVVGVAVVGLAAAAVRRRWSDLAVLAWCFTALPLGFVAMEILLFSVFGGSGGPVGRYFYYAMAPTMIGLSGALVIALGRNWAPVAAAAAITAALILEAQMADDLIARTYLVTALDAPGGPLAPVVTQTWADELSTGHLLTATVDCPVPVVSVGTAGSDPPQLPVTDAGGATVARRIVSDDGIPRYQLDRPVTGTVTIEVPAPTGVLGSATDRVPSVGFADAPGDPVLRLFCAERDADAAAFAERYPTLHPNLTLDELRLVLPALAALAGAGTLAVAGWAAADTLRRRRR